MKIFNLSFPQLGVVVATRAMLGVGIGMLAAGRMNDDQRRAVGLTLLSIGAATTIPAAMAVFRSRKEMPAPAM